MFCETDVSGRRLSGGHGLIAAQAACAVGLLYAVVSCYWGAGGTALLGTVGGSLARSGHRHEASVLAAVWLAAALKTAAAYVPLRAVCAVDAGGGNRATMVLAWGVGVALVAYGGILTGAELLVEGGAIRKAATADERALAWHAYLWDPWFLVWGLLVITALRQSRRSFAARVPDMIPET
jgi:uncharacterized protein DUF3995